MCVHIYIYTHMYTTVLDRAPQELSEFGDVARLDISLGTVLRCEPIMIYIIIITITIIILIIIIICIIEPLSKREGTSTRT